MTATSTTVCHMTRFKVKVKVKVTQDRKLRKWPIAKSIASVGIHIGLNQNGE